MKNRIGIGLIGAGFAGEVHARSYRHIHVGDRDVELVAVASRDGRRAATLAARYAIGRATDDYRTILDDPSVDAVSICVPNALHQKIVVDAARAGKQILCEKPLTGYFGGDDAREPVGSTPRRHMLAKALESADEILGAARDGGVKLAYAENWIHAPAIEKARRLALESKGVILEIRAQEAHSGSQAQYAKTWRLAGGGSLVRLGSHPLGAAMHLKAQEGLYRRGSPIRLTSVTAEVADLSKIAVSVGESHNWLATGWHDVENWSAILLTFDDGTRATIFSSDVALGGIEDRLDIFLSNARVRCNLSQSSLCEAYAPDPSVFAGEYIAEKLETKAGWSYPSVDEDWMLGYSHEIRDFVEAIALDRPPKADGQFGRDVVEALYAAYVSAEEGRRIEIPVTTEH